MPQAGDPVTAGLRSLQRDRCVRVTWGLLEEAPASSHSVPSAREGVKEDEGVNLSSGPADAPSPQVPCQEEQQEGGRELGTPERGRQEGQLQTGHHPDPGAAQAVALRPWSPQKTHLP